MTKYALLLPEALVVAGAVALLLLARFGPSPYRRWRASLPAFAVVVLLAALAVELRVGTDVTNYFGGALLVDRFGLFVKSAVLLATAVGIAVADWGAEDSMSVGLAMPMLAAFGVMVVASGGDFLSVWAGLELAGAAGVVMLATRRPDSGLRLLLLGAAASALMLIGLGYVYATTGSADLGGVHGVLLGVAPTLPLAVPVLVLLGALIYRASLAPLQLGATHALAARSCGGCRGGDQDQRRRRLGIGCVLALHRDRRRGGDGGWGSRRALGPLPAHAHRLPCRGPDGLGRGGPRHAVPRRHRGDDLPAWRPCGCGHGCARRRRSSWDLRARGLGPGHAAPGPRRGLEPGDAVTGRRPAPGWLLRRVHDRRGARAQRPLRAARGGPAGIAPEPDRGNRHGSRPLSAEPAGGRPARSGRPAGLDPLLGGGGCCALRCDRGLRPVRQPDLHPRRPGGRGPRAEVTQGW